MPETGFFELYPSARPRLPAGSYILGADHDLTASPPHGAQGELAVDGTDFTLKIQSPRYRMPPDQILSTFPPAAAVGDWRQRLPQIVFKRRTLPWERNPDTKNPKFGFTDDDVPPYLALIVLAEGEGTLSKDVSIDQCVTPGTPMLDDADTSAGKYLEVRKSVLDAVFPIVEDLNLLAHVRKVDLEDTELALGDDDGYLSVVVANRLPQPGVPENPGDPVPARRYTAYLVNVEGQLGNLPTDVETQQDFQVVVADLVMAGLTLAAPEQPADVITMTASPNAFGVAGIAGLAPDAEADSETLQVGGSAAKVQRATGSGIELAATAYAVGPADASMVSADDNAATNQWIRDGTLVAAGELSDRVFELLEPTFRFPVLVSWDFVCTGDGTFESIMNDLQSGMLGTEDERLDPALRPEIADTGHISLRHSTRRGESADAWYRGPFVPQPTVRQAPAADGSLPLPHTGDQLRRVVPDGHEDLSRASAFEIGRLLALSKPGVVAALAKWRKELFGIARLEQYAENFVDDLLAGFATAALAGPSALDDLVAGQMVNRFASGIVQQVPATAEFAAARVPDVVETARPQQVLTGLGLDAGAVKAGVLVDGVAAFAGFRPEVADASREPLSADASELSVVQAALMQRIEEVAGQAMADRPESGRRRRDALDRLITRAGSTTGRENR